MPSTTIFPGRSRASYLAAVVLVALTSACGHTAVSPPTVTVTATQPASATPGAVTAGTPAPQATADTTPQTAHIASRPDGTVRFKSPSGAFECILFPADWHGARPYARTVCKGPTAAVNPYEHACPAGSRSMTLEAHSGEAPAFFSCNWGVLGGSTGTDTTPSDPEFIPVDTLAYGQVARLGDLDCTTAATGITCHDRSTGHGFEISREGHRGF